MNIKQIGYCEIRAKYRCILFGCLWRGLGGEALHWHIALFFYSKSYANEILHTPLPFLVTPITLKKNLQIGQQMTFVI